MGNEVKVTRVQAKREICVRKGNQATHGTSDTEQAAGVMVGVCKNGKTSYKVNLFLFDRTEIKVNQRCAWWWGQVPGYMVCVEIRRRRRDRI